MSSKAAVDTGRCVVHIDVDAFYAQCEEIRNPSLKERPLGTVADFGMFQDLSLHALVEISQLQVSHKSICWSRRTIQRANVE